MSDQVSDNGTEHSGISVPGPGRLATGKIIKLRPSEVLRDEEVRRASDTSAEGAGPLGAARSGPSVVTSTPQRPGWVARGGLGVVMTLPRRPA
ncbi:MAG TPA: hypothetical protein VK499_03035 [Propionibacteriaceae bacterium]|nr:hypothetical protein [Propionibacteriaceae bacterium]